MNVSSPSRFVLKIPYKFVGDQPGKHSFNVPVPPFDTSAWAISYQPTSRNSDESATIRVECSGVISTAAVDSVVIKGGYSEAFASDVTPGAQFPPTSTWGFTGTLRRSSFDRASAGDLAVTFASVAELGLPNPSTMAAAEAATSQSICRSTSPQAS